MIDLVDRMEVLTLVGSAFLNKKTMGQTLDAICNLPICNDISISDATVSSLADHLSRMLEVRCSTCQYGNSLECDPTCEVANSAWVISKADAEHIVRGLIKQLNLLRTSGADEIA